jgi:hypothetical protein
VKEIAGNKSNRAISDKISWKILILGDDHLPMAVII